MDEGRQSPWKLVEPLLSIRTEADYDLALQRRALNTRQIRALAGRFGVSPAVFF